MKSGKPRGPGKALVRSQVPTSGDKELVKNHYQSDLEVSDAALFVRNALKARESLEMIVLCADIRKSTFLMKEAADFSRYAEITGKFVAAAAALIRSNGGWFDKFTGDGFLAYWITKEGKWSSAISQLMTVSHSLLLTFQDQVIPDYRKNSKNFPAGVGLSLGIDAGATHFAKIANDLTIVGSPVVGAVRMVSCAKPWELVANVYVGEILYQSRGQLVEKDVQLTMEHRGTKEYEMQEVYPMVFRKKMGVNC